MIKKYSHQGYIAITMAIFLGVAIVLITLGLALVSSLNRRGALDQSFKNRADFLARACLERGLLSLSNNSSYAGNETITIDQDTCTISAIQISGPNKIIKTSSTVDKSSTHLSLTVDSNLKTVSFIEE